MITDEHALLEESRVGASVAELATQAIAHVVDLQESAEHNTLVGCGQDWFGTYLAACLHVRVIARGSSCAREGGLWHRLCQAGILALGRAEGERESDR